MQLVIAQTSGFKIIAQRPWVVGEESIDSEWNKLVVFAVWVGTVLPGQELTFVFECEGMNLRWNETGLNFQSG